ncbi:MAG: electron transport complex subunit E [Lachnospiraceae bacterium]|nr:electron transport complex subunit E [Lachnospiraceae bacterium]
MGKIFERLYNGILKENPTFVLILGMCPTLAVTTSAINGLGMGLTTMVVLILSNMLISMLRKIIPDGVRIPAFIVVIASFVTVVELLLEGYLPSLYKSLGLYIPLIVVNCIILGRAEAYASKNNVILSLFDGLGMGLGFTIALTLIGSIRELLGTGAVFGYRVLPAAYEPLTIFILAPGAFFVLAFLIAIMNAINIKRGKPTGKGGNCDQLCAECSNRSCAGRNLLVTKEDK